MTVTNVIEILEESMDLDEGTLTRESVLEKYEEWDSLAKLSLMAVVKKQYGQMITAADIKGFLTVADVCTYLKAEE